MPDLADFTPLGPPLSPVICAEANAAAGLGVPMHEYPRTLPDGSQPASYREYEMWMLGRKYAHALHEGTLIDEEAMAEAQAHAALVRARLLGYRRDQRWHANNQRQFLEVLAGGGSVTEACDIVGLSKQSAYRQRARDPRFRMAWEAALLLGAPRILEEFVERARTGQVETWQRVGPDNTTSYVTRRRYDNAHAMRVLDHLATVAARTDTDSVQVRAVADDFDAYLAQLAPSTDDKVAEGEVDIDHEPEQADQTAEPVDDQLTVASQPEANWSRPLSAARIAA